MTGLTSWRFVCLATAVSRLLRSRPRYELMHPRVNEAMAVITQRQPIGDVKPQLGMLRPWLDVVCVQMILLRSAMPTGVVVSLQYGCAPFSILRHASFFADTPGNGSALLRAEAASTDNQFASSAIERPTAFGTRSRLASLLRCVTTSLRAEPTVAKPHLTTLDTERVAAVFARLVKPRRSVLRCHVAGTRAVPTTRYLTRVRLELIATVFTVLHHTHTQIIPRRGCHLSVERQAVTR
jgi:hypothetical protein